ncbi:MAG: thiol reductant ABC exporter subunit CydC [Streptococcaceae bacterium]|jgi:ATP-binding cassette subfamily C protein CydC|nr:thiol reductant ABC exporter subunit CydC [Streptococcaceae bacterium]
MHLFKKDTWVKPYLKKYKKVLTLALSLGFLTFFAGAALMFTSGFLISKAATQPYNILMIYIPVVLTRAFGILRPTLRYLERLVSHNWVLKMTSSIRKKLYLSLENGSSIFSGKIRLGEILGLLSEDVGHIQNLYLRTVFPIVTALLLYVFIIVALGFFNLFFALFMAFLLFILIFIFPLISILRLGKIQEETKLKKNQLYTHLTDNILGVNDWILSGRTDDFVEQMSKAQENLRQSQKKLNTFHRMQSLLLEIFFGFIVVVVLWWAQQYFGGLQNERTNWIAAFVLCIFPLIDAFAPLSESVVEFTIHKDSIQRLNQLPKVSEQTTQEMKQQPKNLLIDIDNLVFSYQNERTLNHLNLQIQPGEKIAILGKSGAGKSTLAKLLRGDLFPTTGKVTLGELETTTFGDNITDYIGVLHQNPYLFATTIRNNLRIGNQQASDEEIWQVLEMVGLKEMVEKLPEKLDTQVDEAGLRFSGGESHRLSLARLLLKDTPIVLLDEATLGLDSMIEQEILQTFFQAFEGKTIIWITHHLLGVKHVNRVLFLEDGQFVINGRPDDLALDNDYYRYLLELDRGWS